MSYQGRHRAWRGHRTAHASLIAVAVTATTLVVPLAAPPPAAASTGVSLPAWLQVPGVVVNPPGVVTGGWASPPVDVGYVVSGDQLPRYEITATAAGQAEIAAYVTRLSASNGIDGMSVRAYRAFALPDLSPPPTTVDPAETLLDVTHVAPVGTDAVAGYTEGPVGSVLIVPDPKNVVYAGAAWDDNVARITTVLRDTPLAPAATPLGTVRPEDFDTGWGEQPPTCASRKQNGSAWYDTCSQWASLAADLNPEDTWGFQQWGTGKSKSVYTLRGLEVAAWPTEQSPRQTWERWSPEADLEAGNCHQEAIGVTVANFTWQRYDTLCDTWKIYKENPDVSFSDTWVGSAAGKHRNVASSRAFSSPPYPAYPLPSVYVRYDYVATVW
jgi:hypothetical protein